MKNKQINKFLLMFFLSFTLFFSVSNATIEQGKTYLYSSSYKNGSSYTKLGSYSQSTLISAINNYVSGSDTETLKNIMEDLKTQNIINGKWLVGKNINTNYSFLLAFSAETSFDNVDFVYRTDYSFPIYFLRSDPTQNFSVITISTSGLMRDYSVTATTGCVFHFGPVTTFIDASSSVYSGSMPDGGSWVWDGTYIHEVASSDTPSANYDLAGIIDVIKNSTEVQDNIYPYLEEYFIIPNGTVNNEQVFSIYFYYPSVNLSQFEYLYNDTFYYDLDKTSIDGVISNLTYYLGGNTSSNVVKDVQLATLYYNPDTCTGDVYFTGNRTLDQLKSFESKTQPIIYTTKDIAYYSATWGATDSEWTAVPDTTKNILVPEVVDSEGNIVDPVLPDSSSVVLGDTPWNRFIAIITEIPSKIINKILEMNGISVVLNIISPLVASIIAIIGVFGSAIALISRAVTFIYTLPTIEASRALFEVDVTSTEGLSFTGNSWGIKFLEGLDMIRNFSWNGLNLWNLFVTFVVAMFSIQVIKYVRKHYHY